MTRYVATTTLPVKPQDAFAYHERPGALDRLIPPWKNVSVESSDGSIETGSRVTLRLNLGPIPLRWIAEHGAYEPPCLFTDTQVSGPFASWKHEHCFESRGGDHCVLRDAIDYRLPAGPLGQWVGGGSARKELETMFAYRHQVTRDDLALADAYPVEPMRIAISGASGLVGRSLSSLFSLLGHDVVRLERSLKKASRADNAVAPWDSSEEMQKLDGVDAVIHLAGKSIAESRWSDSVKQQIRSSRVDLTGQLSEGLAGLENKPKVFVCASAIGIYGDRGDEPLTESSAIGDGFLADVAAEWEAACRPAEDAGIRVANARLGIVLDPSAGALKKMLFPAKMLGGRVGSGKQWWSWVALDDVLGSLYHAVCREEVRGAFNVTSPHPVTAAEFATTLGRVIGRPAIFPAPGFLLKLALGEMADGLLLSSNRVLPEVLKTTGYAFRFEQLEDALRYCLGRDRLESVE